MLRIAHKTFTYSTPGLANGIVVATLAPGEIAFATPLAGFPIVFVPTGWNGTTPRGAFLGDNHADAPYEFGHDNDMTLADQPVISGGSVDLWITGSAVPPIGPRWFGAAGCLEARGGPVDLLFHVTDGAGGDPGATQGECRIVVPILTAS